ncbi:hypothetical protein CR513_55331, partial [Mucuna pruriens]
MPMRNRSLSRIFVRTPALSILVPGIPLNICGNSITKSVRTPSILRIGCGNTDSSRRVRDLDPAFQQFPLRILAINFQKRPVPFKLPTKVTGIGHRTNFERVLYSNFCDLSPSRLLTSNPCDTREVSSRVSSGGPLNEDTTTYWAF